MEIALDEIALDEIILNSIPMPPFNIIYFSIYVELKIKLQYNIKNFRQILDDWLYI